MSNTVVRVVQPTVTVRVAGTGSVIPLQQRVTQGVVVVQDQTSPQPPVGVIPGTMSGIDRLAELTDVATSSKDGVLVYESNTSLYKVLPSDNQWFAVTCNTDGITVIDWVNGGIASIVLTGNTTLSNLGFRPKGILQLIQGGTGNNQILFDSTFTLGTDLSNIVLSYDIGATDYVGLMYNPYDSKYDVVSFVKGY
jgi:hypothetical protein